MVWYEKRRYGRHKGQAKIKSRGKISAQVMCITSILFVTVPGISELSAFLHDTMRSKGHRYVRCTPLCAAKLNSIIVYYYLKEAVFLGAVALNILLFL